MKPNELIRIMETESEKIGYKTLVCLANSRKHGGHCIVGKEIKHGLPGNWVRPVKRSGPLLDEDIAYVSGSLPATLDIIKIPVSGPLPTDFQTENHIIRKGESWVKTGRFDAHRLNELCDDPDVLWINSYSTKYGLNDRIPYNIAKASLDSSAFLIRADFLTIEVLLFDKKAVRAEFTYKKQKYNLAVTDREIENIYKKKDTGKYILQDRNIYLCISLGLPFEIDDHSYKLAAGVMVV